MLFDQSDPPSGESRKRAKNRLQIFFTSIQALAGMQGRCLFICPRRKKETAAPDREKTVIFLTHLGLSLTAPYRYAIETPDPLNRTSLKFIPARKSWTDRPFQFGNPFLYRESLHFFPLILDCFEISGLSQNPNVTND
jgi:hypothetical protein